MKKLARLLSLVLALVLCASVSMAAAEETELPKGDWYVGFSNFSIGNSWRVQMEAEFKAYADKLKSEGVIRDYVMMNSDTSAATKPVSGWPRPSAARATSFASTASPVPPTTSSAPPAARTL